jgi:hypothetical protein
VGGSGEARTEPLGSVVVKAAAALAAALVVLGVALVWAEGMLLWI